MKTRSSAGVGQKVELDFNVDTLRITDAGDEYDDRSLNQGGGKASGPSSIVAGLKRTSAVTTTTDPETGEILEVDPRQGVNIPKNKSDLGGAKIRAMLANLNSERD
jgi:hypothetical protein